MCVTRFPSFSGKVPSSVSCLIANSMMGEPTDMGDPTDMIGEPTDIPESPDLPFMAENLGYLGWKVEKLLILICQREYILHYINVNCGYRWITVWYFKHILISKASGWHLVILINVNFSQDKLNGHQGYFHDHNRRWADWLIKRQVQYLAQCFCFELFKLKLIRRKQISYLNFCN